jgi:hypothetical protein
VDTTLHYAEGRPPDSDDRPANAPASATNLSLKVAPARQIPPSAAAFSLARLPAHLAVPIVIDPETGEWIWGGRLDRDGYGRIGRQGVHRLVYLELVGEIRPGLEIDHVRAWGCTSRACCSPWHLQAVTRRVNTLRGNSFAAVNFRKTHCGRCGTGYDLYNTYHCRGRRDCRRCIARRVREYRKRKRQRAIATTLAPGADLGRAA